jgi:hypothetical protein
MYNVQNCDSYKRNNGILSKQIINPGLIIQCLSRKINIFFSFTYPLRRFRVPPGVRVPQVEDHCTKRRPIQADQLMPV